MALGSEILVLVSHLLELGLVGLDVLLDLIQSGQTFGAEVLELLNGLPDEALFQQAVDEAFVVLFRLEAGEDFALVDDFTLFF